MEDTHVQPIALSTETIAPGNPVKGYVEAIGRRKTAVARVRISDAKLASGKGAFVINGKNAEVYFPTDELQNVIREALAAVQSAGKYNVQAVLTGGGIHSQAEALRHGLSRCLVAVQNEWRRTLKHAGYLKRDPRAKERRKFGLKKARKSPQWSKR